MSHPPRPFSRRSFLTAAAGQALLLGGCRGVSGFGEPLHCSTPLHRLVVQTARPRQRMEHFGASACWSLDPIGRAWNEEEREQLARLLFSRDKGIGLSLLRFNFGAGDPKTDGYWHPWRRIECFQDAPGGPVDASRQPGQQWFLKAAKRYGVEKTLACVNSPPAWLTKNGRAFCDPSVGTTNLRAGAERAFGEYLADVLQSFAKRGLPFDYISPVNEPNWGWEGGQEGSRYGNEDLQRLLPLLAKTLRARSVGASLCAVEAGDLKSLLDDADYRDYRQVARPDLTATGSNRNGDASGKKREYLRDLLGDADAKPAMERRVLAHSYFTGDSFYDRTALRAAVRRNLDRYASGAAFWQSEFCFMEHKRDLGMDTALRLAALVHADLTDADASSWSWWLAVSDGDYKDGLIYTDFGPKGGAHTVLPSKMLWALGNWSRFVRPGTRRVELATDAFPADLLASAFVDEGKKRLVVVLVNPTATARAVHLAADRALTGTFTPYITDAARDLAAADAFRADTPFTLPPQSVVTLVGNLGEPVAAVRLPSTPRPRERAGGSDLYIVRCGASGDMPALPEARRNALADMPYSTDPGTGYRWGYTTYGEPGSRDDGGPGRSARWDEGDTAGQGVTYHFEVPTKRSLVVEVGFWDPWANTGRRMDVLLQKTVVESDFVPGATPVTRHYALLAPDNGVLEVTIRRTAATGDPSADPLVSSIRIRQE